MRTVDQFPRQLFFFGFALIFMGMLSPAQDLSALDKPLCSPNGLFEVYPLPEGHDKDVHGQTYDYGTRLLLRLCGSHLRGIQLLENTRWMAAQWSPDSRLLGVEDCLDGHESKIYVYKVILDPDKKSVVAKRVFQSPENAYDLKWFIEGWDLPKHLIRLRREQKTNDGMDTPKSWQQHAPVEHLSYSVLD